MSRVQELVSRIGVKKISRPIQIKMVRVGSIVLRVSIRPGNGKRVPLLLFNGIGANIEMFDPFVEELDPNLEIIRFDIPGVGGSPAPLIPITISGMARLTAKMLSQLEYHQVDMLGISWGGALAQQFAFQNPMRCRRLILAATGTGAIMVPASPRVLGKMLTPRRFSDPDYGASIAGDLYGGTVRHNGQEVAALMRRQLHAGSKVGYLHQLLAGAVWTSIFALPAIRQKTLIVAGDDDPIIPIANAHIMHRLMPHARLHRHPGGHVDLVTNAGALAPVIDEFLGTPRIGRPWRGQRTVDHLTPGG